MGNLLVGISDDTESKVGRSEGGLHGIKSGMKMDLLGRNTEFGLAVLLDSPFCCLWITIISMVIGLLLYGSIHLVSAEGEGLLVEGCDDVSNPSPCTYPWCQEQMHHSVLKSFYGNAWSSNPWQVNDFQGRA